MKKTDMTTKQAMIFLGIKSKITMRKYADSGVLPSYWEPPTTPGGAAWRRYKKRDLIAFKAKMVKDPSNGLSYLQKRTR